MLRALLGFTLAALIVLAASCELRVVEQQRRDSYVPRDFARPAGTWARSPFEGRP